MAARELFCRHSRADVKIGVIGLGYVGLPLALLCTEKGFQVTGIDQDEERIQKLRRGETYLDDVPRERLISMISENNLEFSTEYQELSQCKAIFFCVSTSLTDDGWPDHTHLYVAVRSAARIIEPGSLLIIESTCAPGTTEGAIVPLLEANGLKVGRDIFLAYSPERIDPGNKTYRLDNIPKIVAGVTPPCLGRALDFYEKLNIPAVPVRKPVIAEMAKILENTYRYVNTALVNELSQICRKNGIDVWEVINAAATKPFGYQPFYPGPGVGGSCIPKDSAYYISWAREHGFPAHLVEQARRINSAVPEYIIKHVEEKVEEKGKKLAGSRVLILGVTYKKDVGDLRGSPALALIERLLAREVQVSYHDPFIEKLKVQDAFLTRVELSEGLIDEHDCVLLAVPHSYYDIDWLAGVCPEIVDLTGAFYRKINPKQIIQGEKNG